MKRAALVPVVLRMVGADAGKVTCSIVKTCA